MKTSKGVDYRHGRFVYAVSAMVCGDLRSLESAVREIAVWHKQSLFEYLHCSFKTLDELGVSTKSRRQIDKGFKHPYLGDIRWSLYAPYQDTWKCIHLYVEGQEVFVCQIHGGQVVRLEWSAKKAPLLVEEKLVELFLTCNVDRQD